MYVAFIAIGIDASTGDVFVDFVAFGDDKKSNKSSLDYICNRIKTSSRCIII